MVEESQNDIENSLLGQLEVVLEERFDDEALAQLIEHTDFANNLNQKLNSVFGSFRGQFGQQGNAIQALRDEIRSVILDIELVKRSLVSLGQVGVVSRAKIEKDLIRDVFPPGTPRKNIGVTGNDKSTLILKEVNCEERLHLCKAACCRIFNVHLSADEVEEEIYDWDPRNPYSLKKTRVGCVYLSSGGCGCTVYDSRPKTCLNYSCADDKRIWQDFENMILNPNLKQRLSALDVETDVAETAGAGVHEEATEMPIVPQAKPEEQTATTEERPGVAPPDFSELREMLVSPPKNKFVPPPTSGEPPGNGKPAAN